jgi:choice-of-anchor A domain-containing protein
MNLSINFGSVSKYNVFVLENMEMRNTYAEGRVAVGGNVNLENYEVGSRLRPLPSYGEDDSLVIGGEVNVIGGSNSSGNTVRNLESTVISYTMSNPKGAFITGSPIYFAAKEAYLKGESIFWSKLSPKGTLNLNLGCLTLKGVDSSLNIFKVDANNIAEAGLELKQLNSINIDAPLGSTILINVTGINIAFGRCQILRNGVPASRNDARTILWNFPEAANWTNNTTSIYGSVLAPFASAKTIYGEINGNIIFKSFSGNAESHNELFEGTLPNASPLTATIKENTSETKCIPTCKPPNIEDALTDVVESIALEEVGLAHIINAEGEKIQKALDIAVDINELNELNGSVKDTLVNVIKMQMLLEFKIEEVKKIVKKRCEN